ncbi:thiol peroxidase [Olleya sp. YS]|uniref:thiol peroxidase n=1 Tax=Olleya sp. YS TaxID=3028318 RepID=UPI002434655E|nr:thiol peroxidase [Olleya sp. YS]WGD34707.1 thiol peroxidase [Olleya sp. YS]
MAKITLGGTPVETCGTLPKIGTKAPNFTLTVSDLSTQKLSDFEGHKVVLNIFPSVDTGVCAASIRAYNKEAAEMKNTKVLCISRDLPFAQARFCGAEGIENVMMLSDFKTGQFGKDYGLEFSTGAFEGLHSRVVIVLDENGIVKYTEQVPEIGEEPNYKASLYALLDE